MDKIGKSFSFNVMFQKWLKANAGKTYRDAIDAYYQIIEEKQKGKTKMDGMRVMVQIYAQIDSNVISRVARARIMADITKAVEIISHYGLIQKLSAFREPCILVMRVVLGAEKVLLFILMLIKVKRLCAFTK